MNHALIYLTDTDSFMVLNMVSCRKSGYRAMKNQAGDFAIFIGWL